MKIGDNPADPIVQRTDAAARELLGRFGKAAHDFSYGAIVAAALNLLVNGLRQAHDRRDAALARYDQLAAEGRAKLADSFDAAGRRRNVFPYDQRVEVPAGLVENLLNGKG